MGSCHALNINTGKIDKLILSAVCDIDEQKLSWAEQSLPGVKRFTDYKEMIDSGTIDSILISTPHYIHPDIAIYAFSKGLHVLIEKPAGVYTSQVEHMNETAKKAGTVFSIMFNQRTNPLFAKAREIVQSGRLGELKRFVWIVTNWYRTQSYYDSGSWRATWAGEGGGVLINQCPHNLDIWQWIFGMPDKIFAECHVGKYHNIEVEDDVTIFANYKSGATAVFITTTGETPGTNRLEISGDLGKLVIEDSTIKLWKLGVKEREFCFTEKQGFSTPPTEYEEIHIPDSGSGHIGILDNFTKAIINNEPLLSPGTEGIYGLTISNAAYLSSWTGKPVTLPLDKELYHDMLKKHIAESKQKNHAIPEKNNISGSYNKRWDVNW